MLRHLRQNAVGYLALFVALGGTSYAAAKLSANSVGSRQIRNNAVTRPKIKRGAVGTATLGNSSVTTQKVKDGSLRKEDFQAGQLPEAFAGVLPARRSLRGTWSASGGSDADLATVVGSVSFGVVLRSAPAATFVADGDAASATCPGSVSAPTAAPGNLCVYENPRRVNVAVVSLLAPHAANYGTASPFGTLVEVESQTSGPVSDSGSWAVTAP